MNDTSFFITSMPSSRPADYYLGFMDGCVFLDFNKCANGRVCLKRISFDGYGGYDLGEQAVPLNEEQSGIFKSIIQNNISDQDNLFKIVKETIACNKNLISVDALKEYDLL